MSPAPRIAQLLHGPFRFGAVQTLFLRALGLVYLSAFAALAPQIVGLIGDRGVAPASQFLTAVHAEIGAVAYWQVPSLFWFRIRDGLLLAACIAGCAASLLLLVTHRFARFAAGVCFVLYLSLVVVGAPFTNFQWDALLLESGFLAIFAGVPLLTWAYRFLLFRLMFESGLVKLLSHDPNWRNGHALRFHFLTQPLPNPIAYYAYRLPVPVLDALTWATLAIELVSPFFLFAPRRLRYAGTLLLAVLQFVILLTGNYAFFNWLTLALCLWALDPADLPVRWFPRSQTANGSRLVETLRLVSSAVLFYLMLIGGGQLALMLLQQQNPLFSALTRPIAPLEIVNTYGLFAVMTTSRPEIVLEGSDDGVSWHAYEFRFKPGSVTSPPRWVAPYHPRLDWQMWFAALGSPGESPWIAGLFYRILHGEPAVLRLLAPSPFPHPPRYLRAVLYDYTFTRPAERARTRAVWSRKQLGIWYGPVALGGHASSSP